MCKFLVERGADPRAKRNNGGTALHAAAECGNEDVCRYLVEDCGLDVNAECQDTAMRQRTPLGFAAQYGREEVCKYLLKRCAIVDAGFQPLATAALVYFLPFLTQLRTATLKSFSFS